MHQPAATPAPRQTAQYRNLFLEPDLPDAPAEEAEDSEEFYGRKTSAASPGV